MNISNLWAGKFAGNHFAREVAILPVIVLVLIWLYGPSLNFSFFFDDFVTLDSSRLESLSDVVKSFSPFHSGADPSERVPFYRPLSTYIYFGTMQTLGGANPLYFRIVNLVLLGIISFMVYNLIRILTEDRWAGFFGAILYSLNTSHALTQLWISCAAELITTLMATISFVAYVTWVKNRRVVCFVISILSFSLGLLSKEIAFAVPAFLLLFELLYTRPADRRDFLAVVKRLSPFAVVGIAYLLFWLKYLGVPGAGAYRLSVGSYVIKNFVRYLSWSIDTYVIGFLHVSPSDTLVLQNMFQEGGWWLIFLKMLFVALPFVYLARRKHWRITKEALFSLGWFSAALLPVIFAPDRLYHYYLLLPDVGLLVLIGVVVSKTLKTLAPRTSMVKTVIGMVFIGAVLYHSTHAIRREEAPLAVVTQKMKSIDRQLLDNIPSPPDYSNFVFSGDYGAWWVKNLSPAVRVLYDNPTLNATAMENGRIPEKVERASGPVYLVDVRDAVVSVTHPR